MNKLKKHLLLAAAIILALSFSACRSESAVPAEEGPPPPAVTLDEDEDEDETEPHPEPNTGQLIAAFWATDELLGEFTAYNEFIEVDDENRRRAVSQTRDKFGWDEENSRRILITANRDVGFKFLEARVTNFAHAPDTAWLSVNSIYNGWLSPEIPVVITWDDWMTLPYRFIGIWYNDPPYNWPQWVYAIDVQDGKLSLLPVHDLFAALDAAFEYDHLFAWGGEESPVRGAESPVTQIAGLLDDPMLQWKSIAVSLPDTWSLAWSIMRETSDIVLESGESEPILERAEIIQEEILNRFADSIVTHDYPWISDQITITLPAETAQRVHYLLAATPAFEELEPRHSGHPLHANQTFLIRIEFEDGTKTVIYVCSGSHRFIRTTGTFTWHGDPGIVHAAIDGLFPLLLSYFWD